MTLALLFQTVEHSTPALLDPKLGLFVFTLAVFLIVSWILKKFAWGPITEALATREKTIDESIQRAENALVEARQISEDNQKALHEAEVRAQRVMREAREAADAHRTEEAERTREQLKQMHESARLEIEREKQSALNALRAEVANLAIGAAEKLLSENLDAEKNRKLVDDFIDGLSSN